MKLSMIKWIQGSVKMIKIIIPRKAFDKPFKLATAKPILKEGQPAKMISSTLVVVSIAGFKNTKNIEKVHFQAMGSPLSMLTLRLKNSKRIQEKRAFLKSSSSY